MNVGLVKLYKQDKVRLTYKNHQLKIMLGRKELPLDKIIDPATIVLSAGELPTLRFELTIDDMDIDDIEALGKFVSMEQLRNET